MVKMNPAGSAEEDTRADCTTATVWKLMAEFGLRASLNRPVIVRLTAAGASWADLAALEITRAMLVRAMRPEAQMNLIASEFRMQTGEERRLDSKDPLSLRRVADRRPGGRSGPTGSGSSGGTEFAPAMAGQLAAGITSAECAAWIGVADTALAERLTETVPVSGPFLVLSAADIRRADDGGQPLSF